MRFLFTFVPAICFLPGVVDANPALMKQHCAKCHSADEAEGEFTLASLGSVPTPDSLEGWLNALDRVKAMAPEHPEWKEEQPFKAVLEGDRRRLSRVASKPCSCDSTNTEVSNGMR